MTTKLHRVTLTFRTDGAVDAVFVRKGRYRRRHEIHARFDQYGWQQWGEPHDILGDNVCTITRIRAILDEEGVAP
jgi:hypothetical protein